MPTPREITASEMHRLPEERPAIVRYARYSVQLAQLVADVLCSTAFGVQNNHSSQRREEVNS